MIIHKSYSLRKETARLRVRVVTVFRVIHGSSVSLKEGNIL